MEPTPPDEVRIHDNTKCPDAGSGQDGARVTITSRTGGNGRKRALNATGAIGDPQSGRCLDVDARGTTDNTAVVMWTCHGDSNQVWTRAA